MAFTVNTNTNALQSYYTLVKVNKKAAKAQLRLTSGKRINHVADDTSGYNIGSQLQSKSSVMKAQLNNIGSAKDYLSTAESALQQVNDLFTKIKGKYSDSQNPTSDKTAIADDIRSLAKEIDSIMKDTKFNGANLLAEPDGSTLASTSKFGIGGSDFEADFADSSHLNADDIKDKLDGNIVPDPGVASYTGNQYDPAIVPSYSGSSTIEATFADGSTKSFTYDFSSNGDLYHVADDFKNNVASNLNISLTYAPSGYLAYLENTITATGASNITSLTTTSGPDVVADLGIPLISPGGSGTSGLLDSNTDNVISAASDVSTCVSDVKSALGRIGNLTQTLNYRGDFLETSLSANASSISRLFDADMAEEQMKATRENILSQIGTSMLSVLNSEPTQVLSLFS